MVTPAQPSRRFLGQGDKLGQYEVIRQIAVGAVAELYLARTVGMEGFEKLVCVKRILPQYAGNPSFVTAFLAETRLATTLHHPNIAQVHDIGQEPGELFFAMEYVHGEDLGRLVAAAHESGVPISLDCALTLVSGLCAGLHHAHEKASPEGKPLGLVHRDVSPRNVLVSYDGAIKLVDFGIARATGVPSTAAMTGRKGRISYMSPEQCRGKAALDRRSDVFSIGAILYELTTGRPPFADETDHGVLQQIASRDAERPSAVAPGYPAALEAIVMRALARDADRRFSTALELQNQLEDFAHDNRLRVSPLVLARLMSTLFPARLEEWDHARAQGAFFVEQHVVRTLIESGKTPDGIARHVPAPLPPATDDFGGASQVDPLRVVTRGSSPDVATQIGPPPVAPGRMATPQPMAPQPMAPGRMAMPQPMAPQPMAPQPMAPRPMAPQPMAPRPMAPQPMAPQPMAPQPMAPQPMAPQPMAPQPMSGAPARPSPSPMSQSRLPTPPPLPGVQPLPGVRYAMPVPNMPGAVPIVAPMVAPPVASAGTLVSSAVQAGSQAGSPGRTSQPMSAVVTPPGMPAVNATAAPYGVPAPAGDFGSGEPAPLVPSFGGFNVYEPQGGPSDPARISANHPVQTLPEAGDPARRPNRASNARPTLVIRTRRRSWLPVAAVAGVGIAGALAVLLVLSSDADTAGPALRRAEPGAAASAPSADPAAPQPARTEPAGPSAEPVKTEPATAEPGTQEPAKTVQPAAEPAGATGAQEPAKTVQPATAEPAGGATGAQEPAKTVQPATAEPAGAMGAQEPAKTVERSRPQTGTVDTAGASAVGSGPAAGTARLAEPPAPPGKAAEPPTAQDSAKKRAAKAVPDPRSKPGRSKVRNDTRRVDPKRAKPEAKEPTWNEDSPFMPVPNRR